MILKLEMLNVVGAYIFLQMYQFLKSLFIKLIK